MNNLIEQLENHLSSISDEQFLQEWAEIEDVVKRKKARTEKQNLASGRNWFKARLIATFTLGCGTQLTDDEQLRLGFIKNELHYLLNNFDNCNKELGLNKKKIK